VRRLRASREDIALDSDTEKSMEEAVQLGHEAVVEKPARLRRTAGRSSG
jgi:hypothetical protein